MAGVNLKALGEEAEKLDGGNRQDFLKDFLKFPFPEGFVVTRLLPPKSDSDPFYFGLKKHRINDKTFQCLKQFDAGFWKGNCPMCDLASGLWKQSESSDLTENQVKELRSIYSAIKGKPRFFFNIVTRESIDNKEQGAVKMLSANQDLKDLIVRAMVGDPKKGKKGLGDTTAFETGRDFNLVVSKNAGGFPDFGESEFLEVSSLSKDKKYIDHLMSSLHDLAARRKPLPIEDLVKEVNVFKGLETDSSTTFNPAEMTKQQTVIKKEPVSTTSIDMDMVLDAEDILKDLDIEM